MLFPHRKDNMATKKEKPVSIGQRIDTLETLREQKRALEAQVKVIEEKYDAEATALMEQMEKEGVTKSTGSKASVGITETVVATIVDWGALTAYIKKKNYFHLLQHRVSDPAARELFERDGKVPGLEPFTKKKLTLTKLNK